jgi:hypothetical protein
MSLFLLELHQLFEIVLPLNFLSFVLNSSSIICGICFLVLGQVLESPVEDWKFWLFARGLNAPLSGPIPPPRLGPGPGELRGQYPRSSVDVGEICFFRE